MLRAAEGALASIGSLNTLDVKQRVRMRG
uniref:Uncharacterized protein n=1 Tax=mine drainage metagenome TaxID=410659 RepID=E6QL63_9ZZZZ